MTEEDDFGDFNEPATDPLNEIFSRAPTTLAGVRTAPVEKEEDGDWGEFDQYENPDDIEFPTYITTPRESVTTRSEQDQQKEEAKSPSPRL